MALQVVRRLGMWRGAILALGLVVCAGLLAGGSSQASVIAPGDGSLPANVAAKLYGKLAAQVQSAPANSRLRVIVHLRDQVDVSNWPASDRAGALRALRGKAASTQPAVRSFLAQAGMDANIYETYWIFNGFAMEAPVSTIDALAARPDVAYIIEDGFFQAPKDPGPMIGPANPSSNWNIYQVNAPQTWALGYDGSGRTLANLDTGVDGTHQALQPRWRGIQPGHTPADSWLDPFNLSPNFPTASGSHGTHTMGTIAGYYGDPTGPYEIGQSKNAYWIACRIYDTTGKGPFSYMHACFQFMADPDGNPDTNDQPDAVGNSWADTSSEANAAGFPDTEWWPDIVAWRAAGVIPVFSNANSGPGAGTVGAPASYPIALGVGAVDVNRNIAGFSSRGPALNLPPWNDSNNWERSDWNLVKPEVVAPGVSVYSSVPGNQYASYSGTSMASPHVTGLAGLLRQIRPDLTVNEFYNIIIDTAYWQQSWGTRPNNTYGWGEIDDYAAAIYVRDAGAIAGTITDGSCDMPVARVDVRVYDNTPGSRDPGAGIRKLVSDNTGHYRTILAAGTYTVSVTAPGYYGMDFATTVMSTTTNTLPIVLTKMPTGVVSGTVTDGTSAVAGATISVDGLPNVKATTDANGHYGLPYVPAGTYTIRADMCGFTGQSQTVTVNYPSSQTVDFTLASPTPLLTDDFESGNLNNWTVTGGSANTAIWNPSTIRAFGGTYAARAGVPGQPYYSGSADTYMTSAASYDAAAADHVWLSFDLYDSAESEYDIFRVQVSPNGSTWTTVYGEASPVHGWQHICVDVTNWKSATMKVRFYFHSDSSNWNGQTFEGPSVDNVRFTESGGVLTTPTATSIAAMTPTPGTPIPCTPEPVTATPTQVAATATPGGATPTPCAITFSDVPPENTFYPYVRCLACRGILGGYDDGTFRPNNPITRGQISKIVSNAAGWTDPIPTDRQTYTDVDPNHPFWLWIERATAHGIMSGYNCGGPGEPCDPQNRPYFRPWNNATRAQLAKIDSNAAGYNDDPTTQTFTDVDSTHPFYVWIERLATRGIMGGYNCGGPGEPCDPQNRPYFRPYNDVTRGQASKIVANTFYPNCQTPR